MTASLLLIDCLPTSDLAAQYQITYAGLGAIVQPELVEEIVRVDLATVEGQARIMDWLRQHELPSRVKCGLDSPDFEGAASDFLQAKIVGLTRVLEATLMLNPSVAWEFVISPDADIWSRSCEAYFRTLTKGLSAELPQTKITFT
jgi:hypothetical protein